MSSWCKEPIFLQEAAPKDVVSYVACCFVRGYSASRAHGDVIFIVENDIINLCLNRDRARERESCCILPTDAARAVTGLKYQTFFSTQNIQVPLLLMYRGPLAVD